MYSRTLADVMKTLGVLKHPQFFNLVKVKDEPMPHQTEMMKLYARHTTFGCFDVAGSGKTLPAHVHGILMASLGNKVVYTMPPKLIDQFEQEMEEWFIGIGSFLKLGKLNYPAAKKRRVIEQWEQEGWPDILFLSYDGYREMNDVNPKKKIGKNQWYTKTGERWVLGQTPYTKTGHIIQKGMAVNLYHKKLTKEGYNVFFFDEAHHLCGLDSIISRSVEESAGENTAMYLMTGTPEGAKVIDAYGIIRLINPTAYTSVSSFERQHIVYKELSLDHPNPRFPGQRLKVRVPDYYKDVDGIHTALYKNARRVQKHQISKRPDPIITDIKLKLTGAHAKLYKDIVNNHFARVGDVILSPDNSMQARFMALQIISNPTVFNPDISMESELFSRTKELVSSIDPKQNKIVMFAYHKKVIEFLAEKFSEYNPAVVYGGTTNSHEEVTRFLHDPDCQVIILNWLSGGAGLNLQIASHIIFYECPTLPKDAKQAIARCDRTGQKNTVNVYFMRVLGTISDKNYRKLLNTGETLNMVMKDTGDLLHEILPK